MGKNTEINKQSVIVIISCRIKIKKIEFYYILPRNYFNDFIQKDLNLTINKVKHSGTRKLFGQSTTHKKRRKKMVNGPKKVNERFEKLTYGLH